MALVLESKGYEVLGVDIFQPYVDQLNNKTFKSNEPKVSEMLKNSKKFSATLSLVEGLQFSDLVFILVDTPTGSGEKSYDHSKLSGLLEKINDLKAENKHLVIGCTVLPGYIANVGRYLIRDCKNTTLSYNPEFIAQGDIIKGFANPDMVLIGQANEDIGNILEQLYKNVTDNSPHICKMTSESAEITKLSVNCFITTKISFCNMVGDIADKTPNADKFAILRAVGLDSRIGTKCITPGYGFGGPCFPRDNRALGNYAKSIGVEPLIAMATDEYNKYHAKVMAADMLNLKQSQYIFEGVTFKPDCPVPIIEESQKLEVAKKLAEKGAKVVIRDREDVIKAVQREFGHIFKYEIKS